MQVFMIFSIILMPILVAIVIFRVAKLNNAPVVTFEGKLISKTHYRKSNGGTTYKATFEINGVPKEYHVLGADLFYSLNEGDEGIVSTKGIFVIDFKKKF